MTHYKNIHQRLVQSAALTLTVCAFLFASPTPAHAASYDGQDPMSSSCASSAYTVLSTSVRIIPMYPGGGSVVGRLDLRYSSACGTNWGRVTTTGGAIRYIDVQIQRTSDGYSQYEQGDYATAWTNMVYAPTPTEACAYAYIYDLAGTWMAASDRYLCA